MSAISQASLTVSWEEYESGELHSEVRHEFVNGLVYAMAGGSDNHARIARNITSELHQKLKGNHCEPFGSDMKVHIHDNDGDILGYYPDAMIVCDQDDNHRYHRERPTVLFEVVSKSTERIDKREKLLAYQTIPCLQEYIILEQTVPRVFIYRRSTDWNPDIFEGMSADLILESVSCTLPFTDIYDRVTWP